MEAGLCLGANLGDRVATFRAARGCIRVEWPGARLLAQSPLYETEPVGVKPEYQHLKFLNAVLVLDIDFDLAELHRRTAALEQALGRARDPADRFAPRTLDVDILYAGGVVTETDQLKVPHPRWARRRFVVQPLCDVRPDLVLPGFAQPVREILAALPAGEAVTLLQRDW